MDLIEKSLPNNFCQIETILAKKYIESSTSFTVVGMPGVGISSFIRFLATRDFGYSLHIDIYELRELGSLNFFKLVASRLGLRLDKNMDEHRLVDVCRRKLAELTEKHERVVVLFNRFDQLNKCFNKEFFNNIRSLWEINKQKIVFIFSANIPLLVQAPDAIDIGNVSFYGTTLFLKPYEKKDLWKLYKLNSPTRFLDICSLEKAFSLSGGHYQLNELIVNSNSFTEPLSNEFIIVQLKLIFEKLDLQSKRVLLRLLQNREVEVNRHLYDIGIVKRQAKKNVFFSQLLEEYLKRTYRKPMGRKEILLLKFLKKHGGKIVSKEEIFEYLWKENDEHATDWALNALIYRIRKNPEFVASGISISSVKKVGYVLSRI